MNVLMYFETARISSAESESSDRPAKNAASVQFGILTYFFQRLLCRCAQDAVAYLAVLEVQGLRPTSIVAKRIWMRITRGTLAFQRVLQKSVFSCFYVG